MVQQLNKGMYMLLNFTIMVYLGLSMASPRRAPYTPRRCEGVGRHESPQRLKNYANLISNDSTLASISAFKN